MRFFNSRRKKSFHSFEILWLLTRLWLFLFLIFLFFPFPYLFFLPILFGFFSSIMSLLYFLTQSWGGSKPWATSHCLSLDVPLGTANLMGPQGEPEIHLRHDLLPKSEQCLYLFNCLSPKPDRPLSTPMASACRTYFNSTSSLSSYHASHPTSPCFPFAPPSILSPNRCQNGLSKTWKHLKWRSHYSPGKMKKVTPMVWKTKRKTLFKAQS